MCWLAQLDSELLNRSAAFVERLRGFMHAESGWHRLGVWIAVFTGVFTFFSVRSWPDAQLGQACGVFLLTFVLRVLRSSLDGASTHCEPWALPPSST